MSGRVLFTKEEGELIKGFIIEHNMFFVGKYGVPVAHWDEVAWSAIKYLDSVTRGKATCPLCSRLYLGVDPNGVGWCIKCDWRN